MAVYGPSAGQSSGWFQRPEYVDTFAPRAGYVNERANPYSNPYFHKYNKYGSTGSHSDGRLKKNRHYVLALICVVVPWVLFAATFSMSCSSTRYSSPSLVYTFDVFLLLVVLGFGYIALKAAKDGDSSKDPTWFGVLCVTGLLAVGSGYFLAGFNYTLNFRPYYDILNLNTYTNVDPDVEYGNAYMDAGKITFSSSSYLDTNLAMGFTDSFVYCVTPITAGGTDKRLDFWAVGTDCCTSGSNPDFQCGEYNNPSAHSGLRLMDDDARDFYRLAVKQAEVTYGITAVHPIFVTWMQYPADEIYAHYTDGFKWVVLGIFGYGAMQIALVSVLLLVLKH
mmetsp:Transcript_6319/g.17600  ORF Transcript_6319/g.17600 Transcript_6319/m.17600 type:complete len:336 (-) Transcript_6319:98-1105(-)